VLRKKVFYRPGSYLCAELIILWAFNVQNWFICSSIRNWIAYSNEANIVNKDSRIKLDRNTIHVFYFLIIKDCSAIVDGIPSLNEQLSKMLISYFCYLYQCISLTQFRVVIVLRDCCHRFCYRTGLWARCPTRVPNRKVSIESLGQDETRVQWKTSHEQSISYSLYLYHTGWWAVLL